MLALAIDRFQGLDLDRRAARSLAAALYATVHTGEARAVGVQGRQYGFHHRQGRVRIRTGEWDMQLPLGVAQGLATWLAGCRDEGDSGGLAA